MLVRAKSIWIAALGLAIVIGAAASDVAFAMRGPGDDGLMFRRYRGEDEVDDDDRRGRGRGRGGSSEHGNSSSDGGSGQSGGKNNSSGNGNSGNNGSGSSGHGSHEDSDRFGK